jgi:hypothetical protein
LEESGHGLGILIERLRKPTKYLSQDSRSAARDLIPVSPEYEAVVLTVQPRRSVISVLPHYSTCHVIKPIKGTDMKKLDVLVFNIIV